MAVTLSAELVNGPCGDPALYLQRRSARRALLFDLGDIAALPPRRILRLSHVFVSHAHMDHFAGFDRLVRVCLGRHEGVRLYGPPGFLDRVEHKLAAYTWNMAGRYPGDFRVLAHEVSPHETQAVAQFRAGNDFRREALPEAACPGGVLLDEPAFTVRAACLDHGVPCLGFALEEKPVLKVRRDELGGSVAGALQVLPCEKLAYVTDIRYSPENVARVAGLAADADRLFIECVFLSSEADHAERKHHLTAAQAGRIARAARAKAVVPFHFSPRYLGREAELVAELERARAAG